jgi:hypothetical protein
MKNDWTLEKSNYFLGVFDEAYQPKIDFLIRVSGSTDEDMKFGITETEGFIKYFGNIYDKYRFVRDTLVEVILSQKRSLNYNGVYNAFLLGQLSEEDFEKIARKFTYRPKPINPRILSSKINILFNYTKIDYSPSEIADIFRCNITDVQKCIQLIAGNKLGEI